MPVFLRLVEMEIRLLMVVEEERLATELGEEERGV
jgi:hypothetical protein